MTIGRRLASALEAAVSDPGAWPLGMLGFLARGGLIVLAIPILTLPTPVGLATILGPEVISTGRLEGPLLSLIVTWGAALVVIVALALVTAGVVEERVHARWPLTSAEGAATLARLVALELVALVPVVVVLGAGLSTIVGEVRSELLLPGDLSVSFIARLAARTALPLIAVACALVVCEALDGCLSRRVLLPRRAAQPAVRSAGGVVATAALAWSVTLLVLLPGLAVIDATWQAARVVWSGLGPFEPTSGAVAASGTVGPDVPLALLSAVVLVAAWVGVLLLCGIASLVRAHLWTSRVAGPGDWTEVGH